MLRQISLAWRNIKNNRRTIGLLSLDNWRGVNLWRNKNELSTLDCYETFKKLIRNSKYSKPDNFKELPVPQIPGLL